MPFPAFLLLCAIFIFAWAGVCLVAGILLRKDFYVPFMAGGFLVCFAALIGLLMATGGWVD